MDNFEPKDGFFAGKKAFDIICNEIRVESNEHARTIDYNGFDIILDELLPETTVIGYGEPYATIAKEMKKSFN